jgi:hypothetical protein
MDLTGLSGLYSPVLLGYDSVIHTNLAGRNGSSKFSTKSFFLKSNVSNHGIEAICDERSGA